jgi:anhydro-N-acetylmuramic acid kinase
MAKRLRLTARQRPDGSRWTIGVQVSSDCDRVTAALVASAGHGIELRAEIADVATAEIPREARAMFEQLTCPRVGPADPDFAGRVTALCAQLADLEALVVNDLIAGSREASSQLLAVSVHDAGLWSCGKAASGGYLGLCDAARLAELTGSNVIDAFPARDVARGGQGGPITALAEWVLLKDPERSRVLLDLGPTVRMSYLPRESRPQAASRVLAFEAGPGMRILDQLTRRLTGGEHQYDSGGRLAVQGRRIPELQELWLRDPYFRRPLPRWQPRGVRPERFLLDAIQMAVDRGWSIRDMLCTATHFIAETVALAVRRCLPGEVAVDQMVLTGGGQHNGMLLREIVARLPDIPMLRTERFGPSGEALGPACIALLALFYIDQVPANSSPVTGTEVPRVLGRLTPGCSQGWKRLLAELASGSRLPHSMRAAS